MENECEIMQAEINRLRSVVKEQDKELEFYKDAKVRADGYGRLWLAREEDGFGECRPIDSEIPLASLADFALKTYKKTLPKHLIYTGYFLDIITNDNYNKEKKLEKLCELEKDLFHGMV